jgi:hypothetical protein
MRTLLPISCGYSLFVALSGFLFGQLFFGQFTFAATLAGVAGATSAVIGFKLSSHSNTLKVPVTVCACGAVVGVAMDAIHYYRDFAIPGNYYGWFMIGPFCLAQAFIAYAAWGSKRGAQP